MEKSFNGKWSPNILADCSWSLIRERPTGEYKGQKKMKCVFYNNSFVVRIEALLII
jgi:hypothetical protein